MVVNKFGGTSIGSPERMKRVAQIIKNDDRQIIVLSAIAGTTDTFLSLAELLYNNRNDEAAAAISELRSDYFRFIDSLFTGLEYSAQAKEDVISQFSYISGFVKDVFTPFEERALLAQGELLSTSIFIKYLAEQGIDAVLISALDFLRIDAHSEPQKDFLRENLSLMLEKHKTCNTFVTQGYICRNIYGEIDNLKRGGSDYTAALIGAAVKAAEIRIWTDIDGMHNNDPRYVDNTYPLSHLSYDEAAELAYFGAKILHPSSVLPAQNSSIPLRLKNSMNPENQGTLVSSNSSKGKVKAVVAKSGIAAIKIKSGRMLLAYGFLRKVFEIFELYKTPIDMITTSEVAVSLTVDNAENVEAIVSELKHFGEVDVDFNQTIICLVGDFLANNKGYASLIFDALSEIPIRMISYGGSRHNISILVSEKDKVQALQVLNEKVFLKPSGE